MDGTHTFLDVQGLATRRYIEVPGSTRQIASEHYPHRFRCSRMTPFSFSLPPRRSMVLERVSSIQQKRAFGHEPRPPVPAFHLEGLLHWWGCRTHEESWQFQHLCPLAFVVFP
jgi:hypothetical protein